MKEGTASRLPTAAGITNDIRGISPPLEIPNPWVWVWWTLSALVLAAAATAAWQHWRKRRALASPIVLVPPHVRAKHKLAEALLFISDPKRFCTTVADTIRQYLEERFQLRAPERTTEEFLVELQSSRHLSRDQKQSLGQFLESCDLVKFARFEPTETVLRQLHDSALRLVDETQFEMTPRLASSANAPVVAPPLPGPRSSADLVNRDS